VGAGRIRFHRFDQFFRVLRPGMAGQSGIGAVPEVRSPRDIIDGGGRGPMQA